MVEEFEPYKTDASCLVALKKHIKAILDWIIKS